MNEYIMFIYFFYIIHYTIKQEEENYPEINICELNNKYNMLMVLAQQHHFIHPLLPKSALVRVSKDESQRPRPLAR